METTDFSTWLKKMELSHPLVIAGPCSAETEEQVLKIAHQLKETDATVFRAGIWKPRTRPGNFEGNGVKALPWISKVKEETGMLTTVEVANAEHAKLALEFDIDIIWIGARTTVNPFAVQEIADALQGTDKIVLVKNPINPDLALWIGAIERLHAMGIKNLGAIHRGFSSFKKTKYRNIPQWQIPIDLKNRFPTLPIICDPSHICGERDGIFDVCQKALDLKFEGLMIETHYDPDNAWSDAKQQITPNRLKQITEDLKVRKDRVVEKDSLKKLTGLREEITSLDKQLITLLSERMDVVENIGKVKKESNVAILQRTRWQEVIQGMLKEGEQHGLSEGFVEKIFKSIHQESIAHQEKIVNS
ncbi:bifunctional 3-deoxy-7-phosphoheptulonate synthase/chorismate mutase type II [Aureibaculum conchae]|uniref:bifunctional 3-deoxy-7-phosphoheptulonate synthase/chorismate mutase type II n=1 Tax=Aureibaculum sp. 2308TA14-22 TaxID=3108392 RepID=UPI003394F50E